MARVVLVLMLAALLIRGVALMTTVDVPGDGPSRATIAYEWSQAPYLAKAGGWPPGFMYLAGTFGYIVDDPSIASRILNVILGTLTVAVFYSLVAGIFGPTTALISAAALVMFPLHVHLSASSLTETSFLFEIVAGVELLRRGDAHLPSPRAAPRGGRDVSRARGDDALRGVAARSAAADLPLREDPRATRRRMLALVLALFPIVWSWGNAVYYGDPLVGIAAATTAAAIGPASVMWTEAVAVLTESSAMHLGWLAVTALATGLLLEAAAALRGGLVADRALYLAITALYWLTMLRFAIARGESVYNRYLLFGFVISLPYAVVPFVARSGERRTGRRLAARAAAVMLAALVVTHYSTGPARAWPRLAVTPWITTERPVAIERFSAWLAGNRFTTSPILATEMHWHSTYLPLYHRTLAHHFAIVSDWREDEFIRRFLAIERPVLLLTQAGDERHVTRVERILGAAIVRRPPRLRGRRTAGLRAGRRRLRGAPRARLSARSPATANQFDHRRAQGDGAIRCTTPVVPKGVPVPFASTYTSPAASCPMPRSERPSAG